jgi:hypothetical protein
MEELIQVKAEVPRMLKRRVFAALALRDERFNHWLRTQMESRTCKVRDRITDQIHRLIGHF